MVKNKIDDDINLRLWTFEVQHKARLIASHSSSIDCLWFCCSIWFYWKFDIARKWMSIFRIDRWRNDILYFILRNIRFFGSTSDTHCVHCCVFTKSTEYFIYIPSSSSLPLLFIADKNGLRHLTLNAIWYSISSLLVNIIFSQTEFVISLMTTSTLRSVDVLNCWHNRCTEVSSESKYR